MLTPVDLRSDTVTRPSPRMREAMRTAAVGDDVLGDDPTVIALEERAAELTQKEAALFVPSGCMANLLAVMAQAPAGSEILVGHNSHMHVAEAGSYARLAQVNKWPLTVNKLGMFNLEELKSAIHLGAEIPGGNLHSPTTSMLCIENTHNYNGGTILTPEQCQSAVETAKTFAPWLKAHLDGARIFNAAVASNRPVSSWTRHFDSVCFCLSKGLGAPVGSLLCGSQAFIAAARGYRKLLGGAMRQAGVLAACGLIALEPDEVARLSEDHRHCRLLAEGLRILPGVTIDLDCVQTNILFMQLDRSLYSPQRFVDALRENGILALAIRGQIRLVTHRDVSHAQIVYTLEAAVRILRNG